MKNLIILLSCLLFAGSVYGWGQKGHDVTAYIAECHLTPKPPKDRQGAQRPFARVLLQLDGHCQPHPRIQLHQDVALPEHRRGPNPRNDARNPKGDVLTAVTTLVAELKAGGLAPEAETEKLKTLIHLVGDMHCPMHTGRLSDIGGN